jgi:hypothetical protein
VGNDKNDTKQQQQWEEDVKDKRGHRESGTTLTRQASKVMHADTAFCCFIGYLFNLVINSSYLTSLRVPRLRQHPLSPTAIRGQHLCRPPSILCRLCPSLTSFAQSEWPPSLQLHPFKWLIVVCFYHLYTN